MTAYTHDMTRAASPKLPIANGLLNHMQRGTTIPYGSTAWAASQPATPHWERLQRTAAGPGLH